MTKGSFFGEEELIAESPRFSSVHCSSQIGELVFISKKEFQRRLISEDKIRDYLTSHCKVKRDLRLTKLKAFKDIDQSYIDSLNSMENASMMNKSNSRMSQSFFKMDDSSKRDSLGVNLDISRVVGYSKAHTGSIVGNDGQARVSLAFGQKHQSIMINSLASLEKSNKTNIFDKSIEGYHPNIGRTTSVFARKSDFSSKATGFSHNSLDGIGLERVIEVDASPLGIRDPYSKHSEDHVDESLSGQELHKPTFESNLKANTEFNSLQRGSLEGLQLTDLDIRPMNRTYMSPPINRMYKKAFKESFSVNDLPILKELQMQKSASKTHISSKSNILEELKDSFKPREVLKLKAYKRFEELKDNFNYFQEFRGQKKLQSLGKFEVRKPILPPPPPFDDLMIFF